MKEIKISYLNTRHQTVVEECIGIIKEEMYFATEDVDSGKKDDIKICLEKIAFSCENVTSELADILMDAKEKRKLECIKEDKHNEKVKLEDKGLW